MAYDLHIRRDDRPITLADWLAHVAQAPDLEARDAAVATAPDGGTLEVGGDGLAVWMGHPDGRERWFRWHAGKVSVSRPDDALILRMQESARALGGRVQGDDGEFYDDPPAPRSEPPPGAERGGGLKRLFRRG